MSSNMPNKDLRTLGYVLKRVNYGEADRILNLITPSGKIAVIAKGVRKAKSKLAGGVEMFSLVDFNIHVGKNEFGIVTGTKMLKYYDNILKDFTRLELAGRVLKRINGAAESVDNPDFFNIVDQCLQEINNGVKLEIIEVWFWLHFLKSIGEEMNLYRDAEGQKLDVDERYEWDVAQTAFRTKDNGEYGANEIKVMRLMTATDLKVAERIKVNGEMFDRILSLVRVAAKIV